MTASVCICATSIVTLPELPTVDDGDRAGAVADARDDPRRADRRDRGLLLVHVTPVECILTGASEMLPRCRPRAGRSCFRPSTGRSYPASARRCALPPPNWQRTDDALHVHRAGRIGRRTIAKLAEAVVAPASDRAVRERRAPMAEPAVDRQHAGDAVHRDRHLRERDRDRQSVRSRSGPSTARWRPAAARSYDSRRDSSGGRESGNDLCGCVIGVVSVPSPTCPRPLRPQQRAVPSPINAQT